MTGRNEAEVTDVADDDVEKVAEVPESDDSTVAAYSLLALHEESPRNPACTAP